MTSSADVSGTGGRAGWILSLPLALRLALREMRGGLKGLARAREIAPFVARDIAPAADVTTDEQIEAFTRQTAVTAHHPCGTCKMGRDDDPMAVVDGKLHVRGVDGLRVVDASVFPDLVGGNINGPVIMVAERAADLIRGRAPAAA